MLSQASLFVLPLSLVAPKCAICKDTGEISNPSSFLDGLPCACREVSSSRPVVTLRNLTMLPAAIGADDEDTRWPDDIHTAYFGEGY